MPRGHDLVRGFRSRVTMPRSCAASCIGDLPSNRDRSGIGRPSPQPPPGACPRGSRPRPAPTQRRDALHLFDAVDRADVRMIEGRETRLTLNRARRSIGTKGTRQDLDRDVASQLRIARAPRPCRLAKRRRDRYGPSAWPIRVPQKPFAIAEASGTGRRRRVPATTDLQPQASSPAQASTRNDAFVRGTRERPDTAARSRPALSCRHVGAIEFARQPGFRQPPILLDGANRGEAPP